MSDLVIPRWLRKAPSAWKVRATLDDGSERILAVGNPKDARRWGKTRDAVIALKAVKLEKLDKGGDVTGVMLLEDDEQAEERKEREAKKKHEGETQLVQLARLLNEGADASAARHEAAYLKSFEMVTKLAGSVLEAHNKQVQLVNALLRRVAAAEAAAAQSEGGGMDPVQMMVMGAMGGQGGIPAAVAAAARSSSTNGKSGGPPPDAAAHEPEEGDD